MHKIGSRLTGIFGGTFDPIHYGHLRMAEEIAEMTRLGEMHIVPAAAPRLRCPPVATVQHRVAMVGLAIQGNPRFVLDEREVRRGGASYSIDSLRELKQELGESVILCFVIGADAFMRLPEWHSWRELFGLCHFIIATRPGHALMTDLDALPPALKEECAPRWVSGADELGHGSGGLIFIAPTTLLDISSTCIREHIATGKSIRYLLPDATLNYIATNRLYSKEI
jgi:nicotinate-nucleotide adenylyltransferase